MSVKRKPRNNRGQTTVFRDIFQPESMGSDSIDFRSCGARWPCIFVFSIESDSN